jgi:hypothetical protein
MTGVLVLSRGISWLLFAGVGLAFAVLLAVAVLKAGAIADEMEARAWRERQERERRTVRR